MDQAGSSSRTTTPDAGSTPLLPITIVSLSPPRQTGGASRGGDVGTASAPPSRVVGNELAQTGLGTPTLVIVRSIPGRTVVLSVSVLETPLFLMLPLTVAVLRMVDPAEATTVPVIV